MGHIRLVDARPLGWARQIAQTNWGVAASRRRILLTTWLVLQALALPLCSAHAAPGALQAPTARLFDVTISLYRSPVSSGDRAPYERIIEYFADGVYESSNGAHKIRRVSIYSGGRFADQADIVWVATCHPSARVSGRAVQGAHINMCDTFGSTGFLQDDRAWQGGGYTLAHEWGHYFFSLYDEYRGSSATTPWISTPRSGDDPVPNSMMNSQWQARGGNFAWLNFSTAANNTRNTAQQRVYDTSGWQTLVRPVSADPRDGQRQALPQRLYYPELAAVAPRGASAPRLDLPGTARSDLEIIWVGDGLGVQVVLDQSGSMDLEERMTRARAGAKLLVDLAVLGQTSLGVIAFDEAVTVVQPLAPVSNQATKDTIKATIDFVQPDGHSAIGDALAKALDDLVAYSGSASRRVVYLLTDGQSNVGRDPRSVIAAYQGAGVPLFTFAYGSGADTVLLQELSQATGGRYYAAPTALGGLAMALQDANTQATAMVGLQAGVETLHSAGTTIPIEVDPTMGRMDLTVTFAAPPQGVEVRLLDPQGTAASAAACGESGGETVCIFSVDAPATGRWQLEATGPDPVELTYYASGTGAEELTYAASLTSLTGDVVHYPEPIVLVAALEKELPIAGAVVSAMVQGPDGGTTTLPLLDDGMAPDATADDGLYSAILSYTSDGPHRITAHFDNRSGTARLTYTGLQPAPGEDGELVDFPEPVPIDEPFERLARLQVQTVGAIADDHGDDPTGATPLPADNSEIAGKIDGPQDIDVFRVETEADGELAVRVSGLALGMNPRLRLLSGDGTTVLAEGDLSTYGSSRGYLLLTQAVSAGIVYAEVSQSGEASGGLYAISAGTLISSDVGGARPVGDIDGDGRCTEVDAMAALRMAAGAEPADLQLDVNGDGTVNETDGLTLLQWAADGGQCGP